MGTDGGSEADPGRGTHRRRRLTHTLEHKPRSTAAATTAKKKKFFLGLLAVLSWLSWPRLADGPERHAARLAGRNAFTVH